MKKLITLCAIALTMNFSFANTDDIARLSSAMCDYVKNDDRTSIRKKLKTVNLKLRQIYPGLVCQPDGDFPGGTLLRTAAYYGSVEVSSFIIRQISTDDLALKEHDGVTTIDWAKQAVSSGAVTNVENSKVIVAEIEERIAG